MYYASSFEDLISLNKAMSKSFRKYCKAAYLKGFLDGEESVKLYEELYQKKIEQAQQEYYEKGFEDAKAQMAKPKGVIWR